MSLPASPVLRRRIFLRMRRVSYRRRVQLSCRSNNVSRKALSNAVPVHVRVMMIAWAVSSVSNARSLTTFRAVMAALLLGKITATTPQTTNQLRRRIFLRMRRVSYRRKVQLSCRSNNVSRKALSNAVPVHVRVMMIAWAVSSVSNARSLTIFRAVMAALLLGKITATTPQTKNQPCRMSG
jgi:hypothetical protein